MRIGVIGHPGYEGLSEILATLVREGPALGLDLIDRGDVRLDARGLGRVRGQRVELGLESGALFLERRDVLRERGRLRPADLGDERL